MHTGEHMHAVKQLMWCTENWLHTCHIERDASDNTATQWHLFPLYHLDQTQDNNKENKHGRKTYLKAWLKLKEFHSNSWILDSQQASLTAEDPREIHSWSPQALSNSPHHPMLPNNSTPPMLASMSQGQEDPWNQSAPDHQYPISSTLELYLQGLTAISLDRSEAEDPGWNFSLCRV